MKDAFLTLFLDKCDFPLDAKAEIWEVVQQIRRKSKENEWDSLCAFYHDSDCDYAQTDRKIKVLAQEIAVSPYRLWLLLLALCTEWAKEIYVQKGFSESVFWETITDLKFKANECKKVHGEYGIFVAFWYPVFYRGDIVKFGCLEYERTVLPESNRALCKGTPLETEAVWYSIHIPSSGESFDREARLASLKQAYNVLARGCGKPFLLCYCHSWLLYPAYKDVFAPTSNIASFREDFLIAAADDSDSFADAWRIFGNVQGKAISSFDEKTSLQRRMKAHLLCGGKTGEGLGVLIFDGEKILKTIVPNP